MDKFKGSTGIEHLINIVQISNLVFIGIIFLWPGAVNNSILMKILLSTLMLLSIGIFFVFFLKSAGFFEYQHLEEQKAYKDWLRKYGLYKTIHSIIAMTYALVYLFILSSSFEVPLAI